MILLLMNFLELAQCQGWRTWGDALHVKSSAGQYILEYTIFILYSVRTFSSYSRLSTLIQSRRLFLLFVLAS